MPTPKVPDQKNPDKKPVTVSEPGKKPDMVSAQPTPKQPQGYRPATPGPATSIVLRAAHALGQREVLAKLKPLRDQFLATHAQAGPPWTTKLWHASKVVIAQISKESANAERVIYQHVFRTVIQPALQQRDGHRLMELVRAEVLRLAKFYGLTVDLPPVPMPEQSAIMARFRRPTAPAPPALAMPHRPTLPVTTTPMPEPLLVPRPQGGPNGQVPQAPQVPPVPGVVPSPNVVPGGAVPRPQLRPGLRPV